MVMTRPAATTPMKQRTSRGIRSLAKDVAQTFPDMMVHTHLTDAARELDAGRTEGAKRHLNAAIASFAPLNLIRHGVHDDTGHRTAKLFMQQTHRQLLQVHDVEDVSQGNDGLAAQRQERVQAEIAARAEKKAAAQQDKPPAAEVKEPKLQMVSQLAWDGVLDAIELVAQHESAAGRTALQRQGRTAYGKSFPVPDVTYLKKAVHSIGRAPAEKRGQLKAFLKRRAAALGAAKLAANLTAEEMAAIDLAVTGAGEVIELAGPKGYVHGWIKVGSGEATDANAAKYHGKEMRGARADGNGVSVGTYDHQAKTVTDRRGTAHNVLAIDPTAYEGGYKGGASLQHILSGLPEYRANPPGSKGAGSWDVHFRSKIAQFSNWEGACTAIGLSAQTATASTVPHPFGKPGGPGLWHVKDMELPPYIQNIARAILRAGRAKDLSSAIAMAKGATNRWGSGRGHVTPEVRAASQATNASWDAKRARAHAHSSDYGTVLSVIELFNPAGNPNQARVSAGSTGGGQFTTGGSGGASGGASGSKASQKAALQAQIKADRGKLRQLYLAQAALTKKSRATTRKAAKATKAGVTGKTATATPAKKGVPAKKKTGGKTMTRAQHLVSIRSQISQVLAQIAADQYKLAHL